MQKTENSFRSGIFYGVLAYVIWGLLPLFWRLLTQVGPLQILAFRILGSLIFVVLILAFRKNRGWLKILRDKTQRRYIILASFTVTINWGGYIFAINSGYGVEASLGYYICPLFSVLLGLFFLKEKMSVLQWFSFGLAAIGVFLLAFFNGSFPWISILLAASFSVYGFSKKKVRASSLEALGLETLLAAPLAVLFLFIPAWGGTDYASLSPVIWFLLFFAGVVTVVPLFFFSKGAKMLPLSVMGFIQFLNPTIVLFLGIFAFKEPFPKQNLAAFSCIWAAVVLFALSPFFKRRSKSGR